VEQFDSRVHTDNAVSDAVVGSKFPYAAKKVKDIKQDARGFMLSDAVAIKAYDMGVILNNGLDNTIEACMRMREKHPDSEAFITIWSFKAKNMYFIEIENRQDYFNYSLPQTQAFMAVVGHKITSSGVIIHEDGTVTYYLSGEELPEKKAQVEAEQKAKQEKKAAQRQENLKRSQETAEERRQQMEITYRKQMMAEVLANRTMDAGRVTYTSTSAVMGSAIAAYEKNIMDAAGILK
jgi:FtsZ-interacting cell division protein YlmF